MSQNVPVVSISQSNFSNFELNIGSEFLTYFAYFNGNKSNISQVVPAEAIITTSRFTAPHASQNISI